MSGILREIILVSQFNVLPDIDNPINIYLFKANDKNIRIREICPKLR